MNFYLESWYSALAECSEKLEPADRNSALKVHTVEDFRNCLSQLQHEKSDVKSQEALVILLAEVNNYVTSANFFVKMMKNLVDVSLLLGLLFLVIQISLEAEETIDHIIEMIKEIGQKLMLLNEKSSDISDHGSMQSYIIQVHNEIYTLWLNIIIIFRSQPLRRIDNYAWEGLKNHYEQAIRSIDNQSKLIEETIKKTRKLQKVDLAELRNALSLEENAAKDATLPCNTIPVARNIGFFGREDELREMDQILRPSEERPGMLSVAICGLGGIGKSQIALEYACRKMADLDAVLWFNAETERTLQQELSEAAVRRLKLPGAEPLAHQQNAVLVMDWLKRTEAKWLIIYDNVESSRILDLYWPAAHRGSILITTRSRSMAVYPTSRSIEITEFGDVDGARFLIRLLQGVTINENDREFEVARSISQNLGGLPLAISQMAAFINARGMTLDIFIRYFDRYPKQVLRTPGRGSIYSDYNRDIETVWKMSFDALDADARTLLGIISYLAPEAIPQQLFNGSDESLTRPSLAFCADEYGRESVMEQLTDLALVKANVSNETLSVPRLVQHEFLSQMSRAESQDAFDSAVLLLLDISMILLFAGKGKIGDRDWFMGERYISQVLALLKNYRSSQNEAEPLQPSPDLINLILDATWSLDNNDTANNIGTVIETGFVAWRTWSVPDKDELLYSTLLHYAAMHDMWTGDFERAQERAQQALVIALRHLPSDDEQVLNCYNDVGLAYGCRADYVNGEKYLHSAEEIFLADPERYPAKGILLNANIARNNYCNGSYETAERRLDSALAEAHEMQSEYLLTVIHIAFGSLFCRSNNLPQADSHLERAATALQNIGKTRRIILTGYLAYWFGRVRLAQGRFNESIEHLETAITLDKVLVSPRGYCARNLYALSRAQFARSQHSSDDERRAQLLFAMEIQKQAQETSGRNLTLRQDVDEWDLFDSLVRIVER